MKRTRPNGFQQAHAEVTGGGRRLPGARAPKRQSGALPRARADRAARPGAAATAGRRPRVAARRGRGTPAYETHDPGLEPAAERLARLLTGARPRRGRSEAPRGRLRLDRA